MQCEEDGEDDVSVKAHLEALQLECRRRDPNLDILAEKMAKTNKHRTEVIRQNPSVLPVLEEFPALKIPSIVRIVYNFVIIVSETT